MWRTGNEVFRLTQGLWINKPHGHITIPPVKLPFPAVPVLQVWVICSLVSLRGLAASLCLHLCFHLSAQQQTAAADGAPYPQRSREAPDLKCKRVSGDEKEVELMPWGGRRQGRLPLEHKANSNTNRLPVQDKPTNHRLARWQVAAAWTRL